MRTWLLIAAFVFLPASPASAQVPLAPPRSAADILAILDQYKPDPAALAKLRAQAEAQPPDTKHEQELAVFFHKRARANENLGRFSQQTADLYRAKQYVLESGLPDTEGDGEKNRILVDISAAELFGGNWLKAIDVSKAVADHPASGIVGRTNLVAAYASLGDISAAKAAMSDVRDMLAQMKRYPNWGTWGPLWQLLADRAQSLLLEAQGSFGEAERLWRKQLIVTERGYAKLERYRSYDPRVERAMSRFLLNWALTESLLARNLRHQTQSAESEYHARRSLLRLLQALGRYSTYTAGAITELGWSIFESGRFLDSEVLGRAAVNSFKVAGTPMESLLMAEARNLVGSALVGQGRWQAAVEIFQIRDAGLALDKTQYDKKNGHEPEWGIALLRTGENKKALAMLESLYQKRLASGLPNFEYFTAQSRGFYAMALAADGQSEKALTEFQGAIPILLDEARRTGGSEQGGAVARQMRLVWILESYMKLLVDLRDSPLLKTAGIDAAAEAFRIADVARGSAVQRALAESAARATPSDPALADLARREQDAQQRFATLSDLLNRLLSAPPEQQLPKIITDLRRDIDALRGERDNLKLELAQRFPDYAELIAPKPTTLSQTQSALAADEALISIYVGTERSYVWAVPKIGPVALAEVRLGEADIAARVAGLRKSLDVGDVQIEAMPHFDVGQAHDLYRLLLRPVEAGWREAKNLIVVPHRALGQLPFAVLATAPPGAGPAGSALYADYRQAPWLIRKAAVSQLPSVSTLLALRRTPAAKPGRKEFIGFGDPYFSPDMALAANGGSTRRRRLRNLSIATVASKPTVIVADAPVPVPSTSVANSSGLAQLSRLPDTAEEITSIARVLKADPAGDVFLGAAASEENVKLGQLDNRRVVMFATHGLVPGDLNGLTQPALALSAPEVTGNAGDDGLLTMDEILGLKLNADWVVLSACNTAAGDGAGSEAVSGLGKAFFFAGARTLLVSNWPVETVSAKLLTTRLFETQANNPAVTRADALRQSMLDLMDKAEPEDSPGGKRYTYAHPMFWAPFSLVGDGGR